MLKFVVVFSFLTLFILLNFKEESTAGCLEYYLLSNTAYCSFLSQDYKSAIIQYRKAFSRRPQGCNSMATRNDQYLFAKALFHEKEFEESQKFLKEAIVRGGLTWEDYYKDSISIKNTQFNHFLSKEKYRTFRIKYNNSLDIRLRKTVDSLFDLDQYYRLMVNNVPESKVDSLKRLQKAVDATNIEKIEELIRTYGYPGYKMIGTTKLNLIIMHSPILFRKRILPILHKEIDNGNVNPDLIGMMTDQHHVLHRRIPQKYGYFFKRNEIGVRYFMPFQVSHLDSINRYRREIGAISLECMAIRENAKLPVSFGPEFDFNPK